MDEEPQASCCFDEWASQNAKRARKRDTVAPVTGYLLAALQDAGLSGANVLDIGCGTGDLALTALARGAATAKGMDLGAGAISEAEKLAEERGLSERATFEVADGSTATLPQADVVVLNRVLCCYGDATNLIANASGAAQRVLAFTAPVDIGLIGLWNRIEAAIGNVWYRLREKKFKGFRVFIHDLDEIDARLREAGFTRRRWERRRVVWQVAVYDRDGSLRKSYS